MKKTRLKMSRHVFRFRLCAVVIIACLAVLYVTATPAAGSPLPDTVLRKAAPDDVKAAARWSKDKAWEWYRQQPWICGVNYIPRNAINYTAMWDKTSFSPDTIDQELALAEETGFNTVRVVLQYLVWEDDPAYFKKTFAQFLAICAKHNIRAMPCFFDDCVFGINSDPHLGKQPEPLEGWYAWAWSPSPGHSRVVDSSYYPMLKKYVQDMLQTFKEDKRVLAWDLYNEPTNGGLGTTSLPLLRKVFHWAREVNPSQPLTVAYWNRNERLNDIIFSNADIITFHDYEAKEQVAKLIQYLKQQGRPLICSEWLNRPMHSTVAEILPLFYKEKIGCLSWGLVNGKTQTDLPWGHRPGDPPPAIWQHDLYHRDLTPYNKSELALFKKYIDAAK